jgi:hypothetical protein
LLQGFVVARGGGASGAAVVGNCGHFPAAHARQTSAAREEQPAAAAERAAQQEEVRRMDGLLGVSVADLSHSWSIEANELKLEALLGEGTAAKVYKGKYRGQDVSAKRKDTRKKTKTLIS